MFLHPVQAGLNHPKGTKHTNFLFLAKFFKAVDVREHVHVNVHDYVYDFARFVTDRAELRAVVCGRVRRPKT
jgi:hypothetical protein